MCVYSRLKAVVFPIKRGNGNKYLDYLTLRKKILPYVTKAEDKELAEGGKVNKHLAKKGFDLEVIKEFNKKADKRFENFHNIMKQITDK